MVDDALHKLIIGAFNEGFERDHREQDAVRAEIKQRGTYWAGTEIWDLRRRVASLRKQLAERDKPSERY
jgi:hypothetical protein